MNLFTKELEIASDQGFDPKIDIFDRKVVGENLQSLIEASQDSLTLAIDGRWGTGKSVFLKMWAGHLRSQGFPVIYFDAFREDLSGDAFLALSGEVLKQASNLKLPASRRKQFASAASAVGGTLLRRAGKVAVRVATAGALDATDLKEVGNAAIKAIGDEAEEVFSKYLQEYQCNEDSRSAFLDSLAEIRAAANQAQSDKVNVAIENDTTRDLPLVFIIDELDRCRPKFAIDIIEVSKHFFSAPKTSFVFGLNYEELAQLCFPTAENPELAISYLQKFFHLRITLPEMRSTRSDVRSRFIGALKETHGIETEDEAYEDALFDEIERIACSKNFSFREIERIASFAVLGLARHRKNHYNQAQVLAGLCTLRVITPGLFEKLKSSSCSSEEIFPVIGLDPAAVSDEDWMEQRLIDLWQYHLNEEMERERVQQFSGSISRYALRRSDLMRIMLNNVADAFILRIE